MKRSTIAAIGLVALIPWGCSHESEHAAADSATTRVALPATQTPRESSTVSASSSSASTPSSLVVTAQGIGALRVGISARLAKQAFADAFGLDV